jgi:hypothetical protein
MTQTRARLPGKRRRSTSIRIVPEDATQARSAIRSPAAWRALAAGFALCSCVHGQARFEVRQASDVSPAPVAISLLGAYEGGRMNAAIGSDFGRSLADVLGSEPCGAGFSDQLQVVNPEGFSALAAEAESRGVDSEVLRMIAPAASGDLILALDMSGRLLTGEDEPSSPSEPPKPNAPPSDPGPSALHRGGGFGRHPPGSEPSSTPPAAAVQPFSDLEVAATFYSVRQQRIVSSVTMYYSGSSLGDGLQQLAGKVGGVFPHAVCRPWNWEHVRVVHERDAAGLPLPLFHLVPTDQ